MFVFVCVRQRQETGDADRERDTGRAGASANPREGEKIGRNLDISQITSAGEIGGLAVVLRIYLGPISSDLMMTVMDLCGFIIQRGKFSAGAAPLMDGAK